jgi:hypothetical protein
VAGGTLSQWEGLTIGALLPGMLVTARVRQVRLRGCDVGECYAAGRE